MSRVFLLIFRDVCFGRALKKEEPRYQSVVAGEHRVGRKRIDLPQGLCHCRVGRAENRWVRRASLVRCRADRPR